MLEFLRYRNTTNRDKKSSGCPLLFSFHDLKTDFRFCGGCDCLLLDQFGYCACVGGFIDLDSVVRCIEPRICAHKYRIFACSVSLKEFVQLAPFLLSTGN